MFPSISRGISNIFNLPRYVSGLPRSSVALAGAAVTASVYFICRYTSVSSYFRSAVPPPHLMVTADAGTATNPPTPTVDAAVQTDNDTSDTPYSTTALRRSSVSPSPNFPAAPPTSPAVGVLPVPAALPLTSPAHSTGDFEFCDGDALQPTGDEFDVVVTNGASPTRGDDTNALERAEAAPLPDSLLLTGVPPAAAAAAPPPSPASSVTSGKGWKLSFTLPGWRRA